MKESVLGLKENNNKTLVFILSNFYFEVNSTFKTFSDQDVYVW